MQTMHNPRFVQEQEALVGRLIAEYPIDEAMSYATGGLYEEMGRAQFDALVKYGLRDGMDVIDLGCGAGRTAVQLARHMPGVRYLGTDVVQSLLDYAAAKCPKHFRFTNHRQPTIPAETGSADFIYAFSLFTHLLHEETYLYLEEVRRVLRPNGRLLISFLEFAVDAHWTVFEETFAQRRANLPYPLNTFIEEPVIRLWCKRLGFEDPAVERGTWIGQTLLTATSLSPPPPARTLPVPDVPAPSPPHHKEGRAGFSWVSAIARRLGVRRP